MPVISAERLQQRSDAILDSARSVFGRHGFAAASVSDIARLAGVSDGLVYRYFASKRDLLDHVLSEFYGRIIEDLEAALSRERDFEGRLYVLIRRHFEVFTTDPDLCRLFIAEIRVASDYHGSAIQELNRQYTSILVRLMQQAGQDGVIRTDIDPRLLRDVIFGAIEHRAWRFVAGQGQLDVGTTTGELTRLLTHGLGVAP